MSQLLKTRHCIIFRLVLHCLLTFPKVLFKSIVHFPLLLLNFLIKICVLKLNSSFSQKPESQFKSKSDYRNTEQAQRQEAFNSPSLTLPTSFHKYNASKMRPAPPVVIQKSNGDHVSNFCVSKSMGHSF